MYVCMLHTECICIYVCMQVYQLTILSIIADRVCVQCMYACVYVCIYVCMYICRHVCMYVCMYVCIMYVLCMYVRTYLCMHACSLLQKGTTKDTKLNKLSK